jgi:hypothetical protein
MVKTWEVLQIKCELEEGLVTDVIYVIIFNLDGKRYKHIDKIKLNLENNESEFVEYKNLTKELILTWVKLQLGEEKIAEIEDRIIKNLEN